MSAIRGKDTKPELVVRKLLHAAGYRYRLHVRDLPGTPDLVLPKHRTVIFVHGCFWHRHSCPDFKLPSSRAQFWLDKIEGNVRRDVNAIAKLRENGWRICVIWECALRGRRRLDPQEFLKIWSQWLRCESQEIAISGAGA